jgi:hypothetical protein
MTMAEQVEMRKVPEGWRRFILCELSTITMGQSPASEFVNESELGIPFLQGAV